MGHFSHHLLSALPIPLLPMIRSDFGLDYTQSGLVISAFTMAYGISQLPAGWLADRVGSRVLITIGICGVAVAGLLVGLSHTYSMMIAFLVLMGLLGGGYHPAAPALISNAMGPNNLGQALGFHMIGGSASYFLSPLIAAAIAVSWGWRGAFIALSVPAALFGFLLFVLLGKHVAAKKVQPKEAVAGAGVETGPGRVLHLVNFLFLSTTCQAIVFSTISFIPLFLVDHFGIPKERAAALVAIVYSAGLWAGPLGGYLSDRWGRVPVILAVCYISGPAVYMLNLVPYGLAMVALFLIIGMGIYVRMPVSEAYIVSQTSASHRSLVFGIYFFGNIEGGGLVTPVLGYLIDQFGFYTCFTIAGAVVMVVTLICSPLLLRAGDR